jgi:uncharacterized membrane protein YfcA
MNWHQLQWFRLDLRAGTIQSPHRRRSLLMTWVAVLVGVVVGLVSGVVGIGGGILFVPALIWLFGMNQYKAQGTSLGAILAPVGIFAFYEYYRKGNADLRIALLLAVGFLVGGYFGAVGAQHIPELWLRRIFALTLIVVGARMFFTR